MTIADKYMSEVNNRSFKFIPPKFDKNLFRNDEQNIMGGDINNQVDGNVNIENLYPDETKQEQLYCYYNSLGNCYNGSTTTTNNNTNTMNLSKNNTDSMNAGNGRDDYEQYIAMHPTVRLPLPSDILRYFDLELNEEKYLGENRGDSDVNKVYSEIEANNPNVLNVFLDYQIPAPIAKIITKRIVDLSLQYYNRE